MSDGNDPQAAFRPSKVMRFIVTVFVAWHMITVAAFAMPVSARPEALQTVRRGIFPIVAPYGYFFSQWQDWRMFVAPDPFVFTPVQTVEILHGAVVTQARFLTADVARDLADPVKKEAILRTFCLSASTDPSDRARIVQRFYFDRRGGAVTIPRLATERSVEWYVRAASEIPCALPPHNVL